MRHNACGCLLAACLFVGGCSDQTPTPESESVATLAEEHWYNSPGFRTVFGDYDPVEPLVIADPKRRDTLRARGEHLVRAVSACGVCHGANPQDPNSALSGGRLMTDRFGEVRAANITPDIETGIGNWNIAEIMRATRASIARSGRPISLDVHAGARWMSDEDARAIAIYLLSSAPVKNEVTRRTLGGFERNSWGLFPQHQEFRGYVPALPRVETASYGRYLSHSVAACKRCHTGGAGISGESVPFAGSGGTRRSFFGSLGSLLLLFKGEGASEAELSPLLSSEAKKDLYGKTETPTPEQEANQRHLEESEVFQDARFPLLGPDIRGTTGELLGSWSVEQIAEYLSTGISPDGKQSDGRYCPWPYFRLMEEKEKRAIALYLKSL